ncbi:hypothetical protein VE03_04316 [Pseudogymnoascus sp. 23342-1-I1]|nr:hypothetical protein VE03_04316 [Pseudogymnoascus sp. 23342-1-I1]
MYMDPRVGTRRPESDDPSSPGSTVDSDSGDSPSHILLRSPESSHPLIPTDTSLATEATPPPAMHPRKQPSLISSHIGIFLSAIVGICACLIFFYWIHGCFKLGSPARPRALSRSNPASPRPGILARLRRYWSEAREDGRQKSVAKRERRAKERMGPCGCRCQAQAPENAYQARDAGPAVELRNYGALGGMGGLFMPQPPRGAGPAGELRNYDVLDGGLNLPQPVLGGAHLRSPSYQWGPLSCRGCRGYPGSLFRAPHASADAGMQTADITSQREVGAADSGIFLGLRTPARSAMRTGRQYIGSRLNEEAYLAEQRAAGRLSQPGVDLFDDEGFRTPPPRYDEMYIDGSRRAF